MYLQSSKAANLSRNTESFTIYYIPVLGIVSKVRDRPMNNIVIISTPMEFKDKWM